MIDDNSGLTRLDWKNVSPEEFAQILFDAAVKEIADQEESDKKNLYEKGEDEIVSEGIIPDEVPPIYDFKCKKVTDTDE